MFFLFQSYEIIQQIKTLHNAHMFQMIRKHHMMWGTLEVTSQKKKCV